MLQLKCFLSGIMGKQIWAGHEILVLIAYAESLLKMKI